jgi:RNA polymerase sigma-70 factor, ECF subfamily
MNGASGHPSVSPADPDEALLLRALHAPDGDLRAFEELALRHQKRVVANCRFITRDPNNAEDLAQEVLVKAFFGLRTFERKSSFGHWLRRIKINHCLNHLKKQREYVSIDLDNPGMDDLEELKVDVTAERLAGAISDRQTITAVLESMPATLRIPLILCDMDELSYEEVAQTLQIGLSATKMRIKRARDDFRARYEKARSIPVTAGAK